MAILSTEEKRVLLMAASWLEELSSIQGNAGCNDFMLDNTPQNIAMWKAMQEWNSKDCKDDYFPKPDTKQFCIPDFFLVGYLRHLLIQMAKEVPASQTVPGVTSILDAEEGEG